MEIGRTTHLRIIKSIYKQILGKFHILCLQIPDIFHIVLNVLFCNLIFYFLYILKFASCFY